MFLPPTPDKLHWALSRFSKKINIYRQDFYYEMSISCALEILQDNVLSCLSNIALLIIKPDAEAMGRVPLIIQLLSSSGYEIVYMRELHITHTQTTELWKYQWSAASVDRIIVNEKLMEMGHSFLLILKNRQYAASIKHPLSAFLTKQKGSADGELRSAQHFRSILKPLNIILNYIHTADEPADVVRELGILLSSDELLNMYKEIFYEGTTPYTAILAKIQDYKMADTDNPGKLLLSLWRGTNKGALSPDQIALERHFYDASQGKCNLDLRLLLSAGIINQWTWEWIIAVSFFIQYGNGNEVII